MYEPAKRQFGGMGSFGSGAAMRVAPVVILFKDNLDSMIEVRQHIHSSTTLAMVYILVYTKK